MPITKDQADVLKGIIDQDANLASANLRLNDVPDYDQFVIDYETKFKKPDLRKASPLAWTRYWMRQDRHWFELVNKSLLPENVTGACVIGGFTLAALKAGFPVQLSDLLANGGKKSADSGISIAEVGKKTQKVLKEFTGMNFEELVTMQGINDMYNPDSREVYDMLQKNNITNRFYRKDESVITTARRKALKAYIDSITIK